MSRVNYFGTHWSTNQALFTSHFLTAGLGPARVNFGQPMGGTFASALLGPDLYIGGIPNFNQPSAVGPGWNAPWGNAAAGGPAVTFTTDANFNWFRGHLVNGEWGGSGTNWLNLTPLTVGANNNHSTIENRIRVFLQRAYAYEINTNPRPTFWYGVWYKVRVSTVPFAAAPALANNLYSYATNAIEVSWRAVRVTKPVGTYPSGVTPWLNLVAAGGLGFNVVHATALQLTNDFPHLQAPGAGLGPVLPNTLANVAALGGGFAGVALFPAAANGFDGSIQVMQT